MSKRTAEKRHIQTPPEKRPLRSPPEPHQSGGQTHRQPHFLPFSTMQDFLQYEDLSCNKTFIKFFFGSCDKAPPLLLYICTEYEPGTPERHRATAKAAPGKTTAPGNQSGGKAARTAARHTNEPNQNSKGRTCRRMCKFPRHGQRGGEQRPTLP